jgi:hypothetical protein
MAQGGGRWAVQRVGYLCRRGAVKVNFGVADDGFA